MIRRCDVFFFSISFFLTFSSQSRSSSYADLFFLTQSSSFLRSHLLTNARNSAYRHISIFLPRTYKHRTHAAALASIRYLVYDTIRPQYIVLHI
ncbi:hypothetical protein C8R44DRAFT_755665 [Mycena epipterygia]|nr:hypothetical protein C8R44DRAFT_755665 [Mycena epipterygia]